MAYTINTPNFGTVKLGKKGYKQLAIADYQNQANQEAIDTQTEANRVTQNTPWGAIDWSRDETNPNQWTQDVTLTPEEQAALESQQRIAAGRSDIAEGMLGSIGDTYASPMDWSGFADRGSAVGAPGFDAYKTPGMIDPFALGAAGSASASQASVERAKEYALQKELDLEGLSELPTADAETRKRVEDALYSQFQSRLDPQWTQRERATRDRLYSMGGNEGDPLYQQEFGNLGRERNDAYNQAAWQSIVGGGQEMQRLFDMGLARRSQDFGERLSRGEFTNKSLMDMFAQGAFNAGEANKVGIANATNATNASIASAGNRMSGILGGLNYNLGASDQWNNLVDTAYGNQRQSWLDTNALRDAQIQDAITQRNQPLNELSALIFGTDIENPNFNPYSPAGAAQSGDYYGAFTDNQARRAAADASRNALLGSAIGAAGSMFSFSDRRLKSNIMLVGHTPEGYGVYEYDIFGRRERGVMAQEVPAEWTKRHESGYLMVDYSKVR